LLADLVLLNANVVTLDPNYPKAQAVAILKNRIAEVGTNQQIENCIGKKTQILDLKGKTVIPGLIDTHIHVADFGRCLMWIDLTGAKSIVDLQDILNEKARSTEDGKWIIGQGWNESRFREHRMPNNADLDAVAPNNPVILFREASMICVSNSKAQRIAGVNEETRVPHGGIIDKESKTGRLTGIFRDTATSLIWQAIPEPSINDLLEASIIALQKVIESGLTSIHWLVLSEIEITLIQRLYEQKKLPVRVNVVIPEGLLQKAQVLESYCSSVLRFLGATINVDGYLDSKEAALFEPYSDDPNNRGKLFSTEATLSLSVEELLSKGLQPIILAMGDRAVDVALNVIEKSPKGRVRFRIEQAALLNHDLVQRLGEQQVVVSIQPKVISTEFSVWSAIQRLGLDRARWLHPLKTLLSSGVRVVGGSDCPMEPLNPLLGIQDLVVRKFFPEERLTVKEALSAYTLDAAFSSGEENLKGSVEEGKLADLVVLSEDPFSIDPARISMINVDFVIVDGEIVVS
jgi:predicted amidohydrolase YtcJ